MKKKNIFLFILVGIAAFLFNNKVTAATSSVPILGYIECSYKIDKIYDAGMSEYYGEPGFIKNGIMTFAYSDLSFSAKKDYSNTLYAYSHDHYDNTKELFPVVSDWNRASHFGFPNQDDNTGHTQDFENMEQTFSNIFNTTSNKADFTCPTYLVLDVKDGDSFLKTYIPKFTNDLSEFCKSDMSDCIKFGQLSSTSSKTILYGNEKEWKITFSDSGDCEDLNLRLYPDVTGKFKAGISYPSNSSFFSKSAGSEKIVDVEIDDDEGYFSIDYIHNLLVNNSVDDIAINGDKGKEKVVLNDSKKNYCNKSSVKFETVYNCTSYSDLVAELNEKKTKFHELISNHQEIVKKNLSFNGKVGNTQEEIDIAYYSVHDYSKNNNSDELKQKVTNIMSYLEKDFPEMEKYLDEYMQLFDSNTKEMCTDPVQRALVEKDKEVAGASIESTKKWTELLNQEVEGIKKRLEELGDTEGAEEAGKLQDELNATIESLEYYYEISQTISFIKGSVSLNYTSDCGIITPELKKWLIQVLDIIKICALVLTLILGMVDFFKGLASGNADTMKKVWTSFSRRLIVVVILFLLPVIIEFVLGVVNIEGVISSDPLCGIK